MLYREIEPPPDLAGHVACLWILDHDPGPEPAREKILPDGRAELIFNLGAPYRRAEPGALGAQPTSFLIGQIRRYLEVVPTGRASMLGVRLQPTSLHGLLGSSMSELTDRTVPVADLSLPALVELEARLHEASGWVERVRRVEEVLRRLLPASPGPLGAALDLIRRTHGRLDLGRVSSELGFSARTLDRRFGTEVGLPPKLYSRQVRLQRVFQLLVRTPRPSWSQIALASGCFDQAHLNREFRTFAGQPPAAFLRSRHELSDHLTGLAAGSGR